MVEDWSNETYCGSCYGAEVEDDDCCNNCEEVREAYRKKGWALSNPDSRDQCKRKGFLQRIKEEEGEGYNLYGFLDVNKVAGNFHFAPGKSFQQSNVHVHDLQAFQKYSFNISHKVNRLAFGDYFLGVMNSLDGVRNGRNKHQMLCTNIFSRWYQLYSQKRTPSILISFQLLNMLKKQN